jgi:hypothetical protein
LRNVVDVTSETSLGRKPLASRLLTAVDLDFRAAGLQALAQDNPEISA